MGAGQISFGPFVLDRGAQTLLSGGKPVALGQRGYALLDALAANDGNVSKADLIEAAWPGTVVEEGNLTVQIAALRKTLGTRPDGQEWIVTVPRVGYRLVRGDPAEPPPLPASRVPTLAVLPFDNLSGDAGQDYFADGVVEDLITALSSFHSFAVVSRHASFRFRGQPVDSRQIARELGVRYLLEGSVRRVGKRLRITAHLAEGETGEHLWGRTFDGEVDDIFDVQDHIAEHVVGVIEPEIRMAEMERSRRKRPDSLDAYDLTLRAQATLHTGSEEKNAEGFAQAMRAIELEPDYAYALSVASWLLLSRGLMSWPRLTEDDGKLAIDLSRRAVASGGSDPEILMRHANTLIQVAGDYENGMQLTNTAVRASPNNVAVISDAAITNLLAGSLEEALVLARRAIELSPGDPRQAVPQGALAHTLIVLGRYEEALEPAARAVSFHARFPFAYWMLIAANAHLGRMEAARSWLAEYLKINPSATIKSIAIGQRPRWPERIEPIFAGLRLAGLPEE